MSNKQPEAIRLADDLETLRMNTATNDQAAAELRRLHTVNQVLVDALQSVLDMCNEDSHARDYASRQTEIRGTAIVALRKAQGDQDGTR